MSQPALAQRLVDDALVREIYDAVVPAYPEEGCGFVFEDADGVLSVVATANRATFLHKKDPVSYPRDGRTYFEPDMKPWIRALREGREPRLIFHSHPDDRAYFSATDRASAIFEEDGEVLERNPGVLHLVVSVFGPTPSIRQARMFRFNSETGQFDGVAVFDSEGGLEN